MKQGQYKHVNALVVERCVNYPPPMLMLRGGGF